MSGFITLHKSTYGEPIMVPIDRIVAIDKGSHGYSYVSIEGKQLGVEVEETFEQIEKLIAATAASQSEPS